jgi:ribosomal protein L29
MKKTTYSGKQPADLQKALSEQRTTLREFRFGTAGSKTKNVHAGRIARKEIARIMTELNKNK